MENDIDLAKYIDHTELKPDAPYGRYTELCREANQYRFHSVCVNSFFVPLVKQWVDNGIQVCSVVGFPHGISSSKSKAFETLQAVKDGATEIDTVINIGALKEGSYNRIAQELKDIKSAAQGFPVKVILEVGLLTPQEVKRACNICIESGMDFVKTSTGFNHIHTEKDTIEHAKALLSCTKGAPIKVKASSFIRTLDGALELISLGVDRIGCSKGVQLIKDLELKNKKGEQK